jgi:hypothetical protein
MFAYLKPISQNGLIILQNLFRQLLKQNNFCNWGIQCTLKTHIEREEGKCKNDETVSFDRAFTHRENFYVNTFNAI